MWLENAKKRFFLISDIKLQIEKNSIDFKVPAVKSDIENYYPGEGFKTDDKKWIVVAEFIDENDETAVLKSAELSLRAKLYQ